MNEEWAVVFDSGMWVVMRKDVWGNVTDQIPCPTLETAIMEVSLRTGAPVVLKLLTKS